jgi:protein SCO1/2
MTGRRLLFAAAAAGAAAAGVATDLYLDAHRVMRPVISGYVLERRRELPALTLVDEQAAPFHSADFAGHWSFVYFGYTYCPDVCPLTLVALADLKRRLLAEQPQERVEYYFVSVDPERDTPARLRDYVAYFDPALRGLTGTPEVLTTLAQATETLFDVPESRNTDHYLVSHSSNLVLLDPAGGVHAVLTAPHDPARLAADFSSVAAHYAAMR